MLWGATFCLTSAAWAQSQSVAVPDATNSTDFFKKQSIENSKATFTAGMSFQNLSDQQNKRAMGGAYLAVDGERKFNDFLKARVVAGIYAYDANVFSFYSNVADAGSAPVVFDKASFIVTPIKSVDIEMGILARNFTTLPSTFKTSGFWGVSENFTIGNTESTWTTLNASQVLLSGGVDQNMPDRQGFPSLLQFGVETGFKTSQLKMGLSLYRYKFENLTSAMASKNTAFETNTVGGIAPSAFYFYRYIGYLGGAAVDYAFSKRFSLGLKSGFIYNEYAVDGASQGASLALGSKWQVSPDLSLEPEAGLFYNESDVVPSNVVSSTLGGLNRRAYMVYLKATLPRHNVSIYGRAVLANELAPKPFMTDRQIYTIGMEAGYDLL